MEALKRNETFLEENLRTVCNVTEVDRTVFSFFLSSEAFS